MSIGELLDRDEDRAAYVRFERVAVKDNEASLREGCYKSKDQDMIYVTPPYSRDEYPSKVEAFFAKKEVDVQNGRVPAKHLDLWKEAYSRWQKGQEPPLDGTSVKEWSALSPAQCQNLINAGCKTIEDLAQANDEAMRRIGMGGQTLRNKAKAWLQAAKDHGPLTEEVAELKNQNSQLKGTIDSLQEQIKRLQIQAEGQKAEEIAEGVFEFGRLHAETMRKAENGEFEKSPEQRYEEKFGRKPHGRMKAETIEKKLQE